MSAERPAEKKQSLKALFRVFVLGALLALIGSWLLAALRLPLLQESLPWVKEAEVSFYLELGFVTLALFGLLTALSVFGEIKARLDRVETLGEQWW